MIFLHQLFERIKLINIVAPFAIPVYFLNQEKINSIIIS